MLFRVPRGIKRGNKAGNNQQSGINNRNAVSKKKFDKAAGKREAELIMAEKNDPEKFEQIVRINQNRGYMAHVPAEKMERR